MSENIENGKKILIVDDDVTSLDLVDLIFEELGYSVSRLTNGLSVLDEISSIAPSILLIDLMMPQLSGTECIRELRKRGLKIPIVAFTALNDPIVHSETVSAGANRVLQKPCPRETLVNTIKNLL
jgi:CheY-like chemotaxis protein